MGSIAGKNWAGNLAYSASRLLEPRSVEELQSIVRSSDRLRALGSRHSFNDIADTDGDLVAMASMPRVLEIDRAASTITVDGGVRYGDLARPLHEAGLALHNLASLPHISVAGACATGTHGSGTRLGSLATAVTALELVRPDGELVTLSRADDPDTFPGAVVSLGALGIVTRMTLSVEPTYEVRQDVYEDLDLAVFAERFEELASMADSVSFFTEWRAGIIEQVWLKSRVRAGAARRAAAGPLRRGPRDGRATSHPPPASGLDHTPARRGGPVARADAALPDGSHPERRRRAPDRVPRRAGARGRGLPRARRDARPARAAHPRVGGPDDRGGRSLAEPRGRSGIGRAPLHLDPDWPAVRALLPAVEAVLEPFDPRPHWGKLFTMDPELVRSRYERDGRLHRPGIAIRPRWQAAQRPSATRALQRVGARRLRRRRSQPWS